MSNEIDALVIRSLPELYAAAERLDSLDVEVFKEIDDEMRSWIVRNGWIGVAEWYGEADDSWLAPEEWASPNAEEGAYLYFYPARTVATGYENPWYLTSLTGASEQQIGLWLGSVSVGSRQFRGLWKEHLARAANLPLLGSDLFLPLRVDRETLATAALNGSVAEAFEPIRETLDRLPELASRLDPLRKAIVAAARSS